MHLGMNSILVQIPSIMKAVRKEANCKSSGKCNTKGLEKWHIKWTLRAS